MFIYITKPAFFHQKSRLSKIVKNHQKLTSQNLLVKNVLQGGEFQQNQKTDLALMPIRGLSYSSSAIRVVHLTFLREAGQLINLRSTSYKAICIKSRRS